ncbi:hypothetical protein Poli38472_003069 [Pythium oligandrum]|uniref:Uncharacterized protein n=1 Tax=Pythium oligandrum TaxID=41045 RepID=A0A8K1C5V6_PYTOL|nr:hypothetical protein Poli38472_003069 [Pythium oligandrum]|eukprot:TMW57144.1 hypothetical protein Poli38472_003069 [Pythium oligandrum]
MWSTVDEFFTDAECGMKTDIYVLVSRPEPAVDCRGRQSVRTDASGPSLQDGGDALSGGAQRWNLTQWLSSVFEWSTADDAVIAQKCN